MFTFQLLMFRSFFLGYRFVSSTLFFFAILIAICLSCSFAVMKNLASSIWLTLSSRWVSSSDLFKTIVYLLLVNNTTHIHKKQNKMVKRIRNFLSALLISHYNLKEKDNCRNQFIWFLKSNAFKFKQIRYRLLYSKREGLGFYVGFDFFRARAKIINLFQQMQELKKNIGKCKLLSDSGNVES